MSDAPLVALNGVRTVSMAGVEFNVELPAHHCMALLGDDRSGVDYVGEVLLALRRPIAGTTLVDGIDPTTLKREPLLEFRRQIGYLPAGDALLQNLSLFDNIALPLRFGSRFSEREIAGRVSIILTTFGISNQAGQLRPVSATDEQRRRAAIARALAFDPRLVILEQPFDGLTGRTSLELLELIRGGDHELGSRRTVLILGQDLPYRVRERVEDRMRVVKGNLQWESR